MFLGAVLALAMTNALQIFEFILAFGAGTGLIFLLRLFWWRINAWSEIAAMFSSWIISIVVNFFFWLSTWDSAYMFHFVVLITSIFFFVFPLLYNSWV